MQSMIFFEFGDIFRCNGSKVENKSVIGVLSKDITETFFISSVLFEIRLASRSTSVVARSYFLSKMAYRKMPPFRTKWLAYGDTESR